jgi:putative membrane protein insertion efficiency factor
MLDPKRQAELRSEPYAESMSLAAHALLFAVRLYQAFFSALMPSACKFYPSCSHYAAEAVRIHGARRGSWLALRRVSRCHPFTPGGVDLVPDAADFPKSRTGFSLSGFIAQAAERRQAEACPTKEVRS